MNLSPSFARPLPPPPINPPNPASNSASTGVHAVNPSASFFGGPPRYHAQREVQVASPSNLLSRQAVSPRGIPSPLSPPRSAAVSPSSHSPMAMRTASSAMVVEYNPQQWGARGPTGGQYIPHTALAPARPVNPEDGRKSYSISD